MSSQFRENCMKSYILLQNNQSVTESRPSSQEMDFALFFTISADIFSALSIKPPSISSLAKISSVSSFCSEYCKVNSTGANFSPKPLKMQL